MNFLELIEHNLTIITKKVLVNNKALPSSKIPKKSVDAEIKNMKEVTINAFVKKVKKIKKGDPEEKDVAMNIVLYSIALDIIKTSIEQSLEHLNVKNIDELKKVYADPENIFLK